MVYGFRNRNRREEGKSNEDTKGGEGVGRKSREGNKGEMNGKKVVR